MKEYTGPMRFAHRGVVQAAPENTLGAYKAAVESGYEGIEIDIQLSSDGEIICIHNARLSYMSAGASDLAVEQSRAEEITGVEMPYRNRLLPGNPPYPWTEGEGNVCYTADENDGENRTCRLITFRQFDEWLSTVENDITIEVEFKSLGIMPVIMEVLKNSPNMHRYIFFSGDSAINAEIQGWFKTHEKPCSLRLGANIRWINDDTMAFVNSADLWEVGLNNEGFTAEDIKMLNEKGIRVFSNLGDYPEWWAQLEPLGVAGFKTNYPAAYTRWWNENK